MALQSLPAQASPEHAQAASAPPTTPFCGPLPGALSVHLGGLSGTGGGPERRLATPAPTAPVANRRPASPLWGPSPGNGQRPPPGSGLLPIPPLPAGKQAPGHGARCLEADQPNVYFLLYLNLLNPVNLYVWEKPGFSVRSTHDG